MDIFHVPNQAEKKIFKALSRASTYRAGGDDPDDAMSKAASEVDLNPEMTKRACELFNITLTHSHFKQASSGAAKKEEDFPIVNFQNVMRSVFTDTAKKTASAEPADPFVRLSIRPNIPMVKQAGGTQETYVKDLTHLIDQAEGSIRELDGEVRKVAMNVMSAHHTALDTLHDLVQHFRTVGINQKYAEFENQCYGEYGSAAGRYLDLIYSNIPEQPARGDVTFAKQAAIYDTTYANTQFDRFVESVDRYMDLQIKKASLSMELDSRRQTVTGIYNKVAGKNSTASDLLELDSDFNKGAALSSIPVELAGMPKALTTSQEKSLGGQLDTGMAHELNKFHKRPQEEADMEMDNIRRMTILKELMMNDEIISRQKPDMVNSAYNTLLQISPTSTMHKEVVRAVLRNATAQQAVDPFTAKQLADLEGVHIKNKALSSGAMKPQPTV